MAVLEDWITRVSRLNVVAIEATTAEHGMTASEASVLAMLVRAGTPLNPSRLQVLVIQSPAGLTKTLRRLEAEGYVRRRADPDDRRALLVELTAAGRKVAARTEVSVAAHYGRILGGIDPDERVVLESLLRRMIDELEAATGQRSTTATNSNSAGR